MSWFTYYGVLIHLIWRPDSPNSVLVCLIWCPDSWLYTTQLFAWNKFSHATAKVWVWWACASICITFETGVRICPTQPSCIVCIVALIRCPDHRDSAPFSPGSKVTERAPPDEGACSAQGFDSAHLRPEGKPNVWNLQQTRTEVWQYGCVGIGVPNYPLHQAIWCVLCKFPHYCRGRIFFNFHENVLQNVLVRWIFRDSNLYIRVFSVFATFLIATSFLVICVRNVSVECVCMSVPRSRSSSRSSTPGEGKVEFITEFGGDDEGGGANQPLGHAHQSGSREAVPKSGRDGRSGAGERRGRNSQSSRHRSRSRSPRRRNSRSPRRRNSHSHSLRRRDSRSHSPRQRDSHSRSPRRRDSRSRGRDTRSRSRDSSHKRSHRSSSRERKRQRRWGEEVPVYCCCNIAEPLKTTISHFLPQTNTE